MTLPLATGWNLPATRQAESITFGPAGGSSSQMLLGLTPGGSARSVARPAQERSLANAIASGIRQRDSPAQALSRFRRAGASPGTAARSAPHAGS